MLSLLLRLETSGANSAAAPIASPHLQNSFAVTPQIYSGGSPTTEEAFSELSRWGVQTILSVDGAIPDLEKAKRHGMNYLHIPLGYDGISEESTLQLIKVAQAAKGVLYVHCHQGKHRGPTAVATICQSIEGWTTNRAEQWLRQAGTSLDYAGLYRSVSRFQQPTASQLAKVKLPPPAAKTSPLVKSMVALDAHMDHLRSAQQSSWRGLTGRVELTPAQHATLLWEVLRERARLDTLAKHPKEYRTALSAAEAAAEELRRRLQQVPVESVAADGSFVQLKDSCAQCHKRFRD